MKSFLEFNNNVDFMLIPDNVSRSGKLELLITNQTGEGIIHIEQNENGQLYLSSISFSVVIDASPINKNL